MVRLVIYCSNIEHSVLNLTGLYQFHMNYRKVHVKCGIKSLRWVCNDPGKHNYNGEQNDMICLIYNLSNNGLDSDGNNLNVDK